MSLDNLRSRFDSFLESAWKLADIEPFLLVYIRLLLLFKDELPQRTLDALLERRRQLLGEEFDGIDFDEVRRTSRQEMERGGSDAPSRIVLLNGLTFAALLDAGEEDFFYLTEPIFEFAEGMGVSSDCLREILEAEFVGGSF